MTICCAKLLRTVEIRMKHRMLLLQLVRGVVKTVFATYLMQLQTDEEPSELVIPSQWYRFAEGKDALSGFCCH